MEGLGNSIIIDECLTAQTFVRERGSRQGPWVACWGAFTAPPPTAVGRWVQLLNLTAPQFSYLLNGRNKSPLSHSQGHCKN